MSEPRGLPTRLRRVDASGPPALRDHQRPHHIVFFVFQDVAMPHVLIAAGAWTRRDGEGNARQIKAHDQACHRAREMHHGFLPADLIWLGWRGGTREVYAPLSVAKARDLEGLAVDHLHVHQVEVHGVNVRRRVEDLPDLGRARRGSLGRSTFIGPTEPGAWRTR